MADRTITRSWTLDLAGAGKSRPLPVRPAAGPRQHIVRFEGSEGDTEKFSYRLTFPDDEARPEEPPSQKQYDAVCDFYGEGPASRDQAGYLMSAWYYADEIKSAQNFPFTAPRRKLILVGVSALILSHPEIRSKVRSWSQFRWREPTRAVQIERTQPHAAVMQFANDLIADMQGAGAEIFGGGASQSGTK